MKVPYFAENRFPGGGEIVRFTHWALFNPKED